MMSSGFVAGTLVHTDKGLIPIQDLKVGDLVLTNAIKGNQYKEIIKTHKNDFSQIFQIIIRQMKSFDTDEVVYTDEAFYSANNQQFFVKMNYELGLKNRWIEASNLEDHEETRIVNDLESSHVQSSKEVIQVKNDIGFCLKIDDYELDYETYIKYGNSQSMTLAYDLEFPDSYYQDIVKLGNLKNLDLKNSDEKQLFDICFDYLTNRSNDKFLRLPTYSLEVTENHNFFVGNLGLLVGDSTIQGTSE